MSVERGERKFVAMRQTQLLVLLAFIIAAWLKVEMELFLVAIAGISGNYGFMAFTNAKVHTAYANGGSGTGNTEFVAKPGVRPSA